MKRNNLKKIINLFSFFALSFTVSAYNWPQQIVDSDSIASYFGQKIGSEMCKSIVFLDPAEVSASEDGDLLVFLRETTDNVESFPSALGNTIILTHEDGLLSVYGNLDEESVDETIGEKKNFFTGDLIGLTGNSGWQNKRSNLEFQIIDTKNNTAVNPKLFMPRTENEIRLSINDICLINKNGDYFYLNLHNTLNSGIYKVYMKRNLIASPYRTSISINGVTVDQISYDTISEENGKLFVNGKKKYTYTDIYPNNDLSLLGEVTLTPGKTSLGLYLQDFNGHETRDFYNLSIFN